MASYSVCRIRNEWWHCKLSYTPNGEIRSRIQRGAILTAVFNQTAKGRVPNPHTSADDAIVLDSSDSPWLRVIGTREEL